MAKIEGRYEPRFQPVADALAHNLDEGLDVGASAAVVLNGEMVVDIWGGHLDDARTEPWREDTIVNVFSTTKTMTALCALMLADRGELDVNGSVNGYWPGFGKPEIEVRHLLGRTHDVGEQRRHRLALALEPRRGFFRNEAHYGCRLRSGGIGAADARRPRARAA